MVSQNYERRNESLGQSNNRLTNLVRGVGEIERQIDRQTDLERDRRQTDRQI